MKSKKSDNNNNKSIKRNRTSKAHRDKKIKWPQGKI